LMVRATLQYPCPGETNRNRVTHVSLRWQFDITHPAPLSPPPFAHHCATTNAEKQRIMAPQPLSTTIRTSRHGAAQPAIYAIHSGPQRGVHLLSFVGPYPPFHRLLTKSSRSADPLPPSIQYLYRHPINVHRTFLTVAVALTRSMPQQNGSMSATGSGSYPMRSRQHLSHHPPLPSKSLHHHHSRGRRTTPPSPRWSPSCRSCARRS